MITLDYISTKNIFNPCRGGHNQTGHGFFDGFSFPSAVAHLTAVKEQSRNYMVNIAQRHSGRLRPPARCCGLINREKCIRFDFINIKLRKFESFYSPIFSKTSIWQFLKVLAMSNLTTGDLKNLEKNWTCVYGHQPDIIGERGR